MLLLADTKSLCHVCFKTIRAKVLEDNGFVYIEKTCLDHRRVFALHPWSDPNHYAVLAGLDRSTFKTAQGLVINLNSDCNQHCPFCFARANEYEMKEPSVAEIKKRILSFKGSIIYLSGGEPTLRKDIFAILQEIKKLRKFRVFLFSNGKKLADEKFTSKLKAYIDLVIFQLDTLDDSQSLSLRGEKLTAIKLKGLENLKKNKIPVYLFTMIAKGINLDQIKPLLDFSAKTKNIKIINFNPVWHMGRFAATKELDASGILKEVSRICRFSEEEFLNNTTFIYHFFAALARVRKNRESRHPKCEARCYIFLFKGQFLPLSRIFDINRMSAYLKKFNFSFNQGSYVKSLAIAILFFGSLLRQQMSNQLFRQVSLVILRQLFWRDFSASATKIFSIIVGTFHNSFNVDLDFVQTCNLFSDYPESLEQGSACIRQMKVTREIDERILNIR
jgi:7,8-dihydro-6-hydroxymethylpterin dimethyltransferase